MGGKAITKTVEERAGFNVRVRYQRNLRDNPEAIKNMLVPISEGAQIPLSEIADVAYQQGEQVIKSEDGFLVNYVIFKQKDGIDEIQAVEDVKNHLAKQISKNELLVPDGASFYFGGNYKNHLRASKRMRLILIATILIIFGILYFQFRSTIMTLIIFSGILVAFAGGFILLWLFGQDWFFNISMSGVNLRELFSIETVHLSIAVWVGFLVLFGISTDDGVLIASYLQQENSNQKGKTVHGIRQVIMHAGMRRVRPAVLTTVTTILALLPILTSSGKGSDIMTPMAIPVLGGMLFQTITIFIVPVLYSIWQEHKLKANE